MKNARERMDVIAAYRDVGSYRGAAEIWADPIVKHCERKSSVGNLPRRCHRGLRGFDPFTSAAGPA